jgi:hypothetical protein
VTDGNRFRIVTILVTIDGVWIGNRIGLFGTARD